MNKALFFACIVTCYAQASVVADLIAIKNQIGQMLPAQAQEKINEHLPIVLKHEEQSVASTATAEFATGFAKGVAVFTLVSIYKGLWDDSKEPGCLINNNLYFTKFAILASGVPACAQDIITSLDVVFSGLKKSSCKNCAQRSSRQDVVNALARIAGSASAMGVLYWAALAVCPDEIK